MTKIFDVNKATGSYLVLDRYKSSPQASEEQIRLLKLYKYYSAQTGPHQGESLDKIKKTRLKAFAKRVYNDSEKYWESLTIEQKRQVSAYCYDLAQVMQTKLKRVDYVLNDQENISLVEKIISAFPIPPNPELERESLLHMYSKRPNGLNPELLDNYEKRLFSNHIYNTAKQIFDRLNPQQKEMLLFCRKLNQQLSEISETENIQTRQKEIKSLEEKLRLDEFEERIALMGEQYIGERLPPALKEAHRTLGIKENIKHNYFIVNTTQYKEEIAI